MDDLVRDAIEDLKELSRDISGTPELPLDSPEDAQILDSFLSDVLNRVDEIIEDLQRG
ncbi:MAG: hypothetical protein V3W19_10010 [Desulfatiglandales bacterium]